MGAGGTFKRYHSSMACTAVNAYYQVVAKDWFENGSEILKELIGGSKLRNRVSR